MFIKSFFDGIQKGATNKVDGAEGEQPPVNMKTYMSHFPGDSRYFICQRPFA